MKAKDLMIGDWVYVHHNGKAPHYGKVTALLSSGAVETEINGSLALSSSVEPIHLTLEILEKNGFKKDNDGVWPRYVFVADIEKCPQTIITFSFYGKGVSVETLFRCWTKPKCCDGENNIHICDFKSVHELQHALRLCGIDKEIVL